MIDVGRGFDVLIRNGTVIDGSVAARPERLDVGIADGRITALGSFPDAAAETVVDAQGLVVAPGFIDPHTHVEAALVAQGVDAIAPALQGITTCLLGADGFGWAPLREDQAADLWSSSAGLYGSWPGFAVRTVEAYLAQFAGRSIVNVLPQVPHAAVRFATIGWAGRAATSAEVGTMSTLAEAWLDAGAAGLSLGLDYIPAAGADLAELQALVRTVAARHRGIAVHLRYEALGRRRALTEMLELARAFDVPLTIAHEVVDDESSELLARAMADVELAVESYLYPAACTQLAIFVPRDQQVGGPHALADRLRRQRAVRDQVGATLGRRLDESYASGERLVIAGSIESGLVGAELSELARAARQSVGAYAARLLADDPGVLLVIHRGDAGTYEDVVRATAGFPGMIVASDGVYAGQRPHPRGYGTFPRIFRYVVRQLGAMSMPQAIHAMTGRPARQYRIPDRGLVRLGLVADLVVFDADNISDQATWEDPRFPATGIDRVFVSGVEVVRSGQPTGLRPGVVLAAA